MKQTTFASLAFESKKKLTRRERFLAEMDQVVPWARLLKLIAPHYPKAGNGRQPMPLPTMLRVYFLQQWFNLSDPAAEDSLYDIESMRRFCGIELGDQAVPDATTILNFRRLLERHPLTAAIFQSVNELLSDKRLLLKSGTLVDATIVSAPSSTKNEAKARDPEMTQTRKGNQRYFGMKVHIGTDRRGLVHTVAATTAKDADIAQLPALLHGKERLVHGDRGYHGADAVAYLRKRGIRPRLQKRAAASHSLTETERKRNQRRSKARAFVEHPSPLSRQAAVGLCQSSLPGVGQEHGAGVRAAGAGQSLSRATPAHTARGLVRPRSGKPGEQDEPQAEKHGERRNMGVESPGSRRVGCQAT